MSTSTYPSSSATEPNSLRVITLKRISSDKQISGGGIDAQDRIIQEALSNIEEEVSIKREIEEKGVSGTEFPRQSLLVVLEEARDGKLDALVVKDVSRIGRLAAPTFSFIWLLNYRFNIDLIVEDGRYNIQRKADLIQIFFRTLNAELKNRFRTSYVHESQLEEFRQGNLHVTGRHVRFGYKKTNSDEGSESKGRITEDDQITVDQREKEVVKQLFLELIDIGSARNAFARAREELKKKFGQDRLPEENTNLKELLRNPIYKGTPTWEISTATEGRQSATMNREDLRIVKDSTFEKAQDILDRRECRYTQSASKEEEEDHPDELTIEQIASLVGLSRLVAVNDIVRIHCPNCGEEMNDNGKWRATSDLKPSGLDDIADEPILKRYSCPNNDCERSEKRFPNEFEAYLLFNTNIPLDELAEY